ncbi:MAG: VCBS repeat-containing protein [Phycisphaerae bacterium]
MGSAIRNPKSDIRNWASALCWFACAWVLLVTGPALADEAPCLADANGDGHPLFGAMKYNMMQCGAGDCETMGPVALAMGDIDGDGDLDYAVANSAYYAHEYGISGNLTIMFNEGDGQFADETYYDAGYEPRDVKLADFNADGHLDVVVASSFDDAVFVLLGNGDGTFAPAASLAVGDAPRSVAVGDVNGDGHLDLAVLNAMSNNISVLLGAGDGTFAAQATYGVGIVGEYPERWLPIGGVSIILCDLDGDGDLDLASANTGTQILRRCSLELPDGSVSVLLNQGDGTYAAQVEYPCELRTVNLAVGDLDEDGDVDVLASNLCNGTVSVLLGHGDGTLAAQIPYEANGFEGPLPPHVSWFGGGPSGLALRDIDADGHLDLVVGHHGSYRISVLPGYGDGTLGAEQTLFIDISPTFVELGDVNSDGGADLAVLAPASNNDSLTVLFNFGDGVFLDDETTAIGYGATSMRIGDLDSDGDLDLATGEAGTGTIYGGVSVLLNDGDGGLTRTKYHSGNGPWSVAMADLDGDGHLDLASADSKNGTGDTVSVLMNHGDGTFADGVAYPVTVYPLALAASDLDGDGDRDLVSADWGTSSQVGGTGVASFLLNNGDGTFAAAPPLDLLRAPTEVMAGDLDDDGDNDLVFSHRDYTGLSLLVLFNNGDATFSPGVSYDVDYALLSAALGDVDVDGDLDLAVGTYSYVEDVPNVMVLVNDGAGAFGDGGAYYVPGTWQTDSIAIGDIDGDGVVDLALGNAAKESVSVLLGYGDGTFAPGVTYARAHGESYALVLGDLDGDGDTDLAVTNSDEDTGVSILRNRACHANYAVGDLDCDGLVNNFDIRPFVLALTDPSAYQAAYPGCDHLNADCNHDGIVNNFDISPFVALLVGP